MDAGCFGYIYGRRRVNKRAYIFGIGNVCAGVKQFANERGLVRKSRCVDMFT